MQKIDHNIGVWENANFLPKIVKKSRKIVIITLTTGHTGMHKSIVVIQITNHFESEYSF
jgi:hypothetical protein